MLEVIREKEIADANRLILDFPDAGIQVLNGRYGPYITDKSRNAKIPKDKDPKSLTLEECQTLLAAAPVCTFGKWGKKNGKNGTPKGLATPTGSIASRKAANGAPAAANPNAAAAGRKVKGAPIGLAAKAAKTAASKKAPAKEPAQAPARAAAAPKAKPKAPPKSKKSAAQKKP